MRRESHCVVYVREDARGGVFFFFFFFFAQWACVCVHYGGMDVRHTWMTSHTDLGRGHSWCVSLLGFVVCGVRRAACLVCVCVYES